jgi:hypothetical protein
MLGQHDVRHDRAGGPSFFIGDLMETRDIGIRLSRLADANEVTVRAKISRQLFALFGIGCARARLVKCLRNRKWQRQTERGNDARAHGQPSGCYCSYI